MTLRQPFLETTHFPVSFRSTLSVDGSLAASNSRVGYMVERIQGVTCHPRWPIHPALVDIEEGLLRRSVDVGLPGAPLLPLTPRLALYHAGSLQRLQPIEHVFYGNVDELGDLAGEKPASRPLLANPPEQQEHLCCERVEGLDQRASLWVGPTPQPAPRVVGIET
jgi:hypothetical protein